LPASLPDEKFTLFNKYLRRGQFHAARQLLPSGEEAQAEKWLLAAHDLERLEASPSALRRGWILASLRPLEVGFTGRWISFMAGFLPLVVGVLALEYPPLWFGILLSLIGIANVWFGRRILEGRMWVLKILPFHAILFAVLPALILLWMLGGGEGSWMEVGGARAVVVAYGLFAYLVSQLLILRFMRCGNFRAYFGQPRHKADYQIASETKLKPLQWLGAILLLFALGAAINFLNLDEVLRTGPAGDPFTLPIALPGSDYLARLWTILYSTIFAIQDVPSLVAAQRGGCIFAALLLAVAAIGLWGRKWWGWGAGIAMAVLLSGSLGDVFRLLGNPRTDAMLLLNTLINLVMAGAILWALLGKGIKLALGADADAELAIRLEKDTLERKKVKQPGA